MGLALIVTVLVAVADKQLPLAAMVLVTVYVLGVLALRSISPVEVFVNTNPVDELKLPAPAPPVNSGIALGVAF